MGNFAPVFLAFILNCYGVHVFLEPRTACIGPLLSYLIMLFAVFILLWDMRLYPKSLRKLWKCGDLFLEFFIADFIMEHIMADFWFPLEATVLLSLPLLSENFEDLMASANIESVYETLRCDSIGIIVSYCLSTFFFIAVLHATRAIDIRLLECGFGSFFRDIIGRLRRGTKKVIGSFRRKKAAPPPPPTDARDLNIIVGPCKRPSSGGGQKNYEDDDYDCDCDCPPECDPDTDDYVCEPPLPKTKRRKKRCQ